MGYGLLELRELRGGGAVAGSAAAPWGDPDPEWRPVPPAEIAAVLAAFHELGYCPESAMLQASAMHLAAHAHAVPAERLAAAREALEACDCAGMF